MKSEASSGNIESSAGVSALRLPPSASGLPLSPRPIGFTLIEILVVIIIISIVVSVASVNFFRDDKQTLAEEAKRLALLLEHAREEALLTGKLIGWSAGDASYQFLVPDGEGKWQTKRDDDVLRPRTFALPIAWRDFRINGQPAKPGDPLVFTNAGSALPFDFTLELSGHFMLIRGDALGHVSVEERPAT